MQGHNDTKESEKKLNPFDVLEQIKEQRDSRTRTENKERDRQQQERQQIQDLLNGVGFSSDKVIARFYGTTRKTIWVWAKEGKLPKPHKIGENTTRWNNAEIKKMGCSL